MVKELGQSNAGPGHVAHSRAEKEEGEKRGPEKNAFGISLVNEVCLAHSPIADGVRLLRMQQRFTQQHCAREIISTPEQQMGLQDHRIVVNKPGGFESLLV